MRVTPILRVGVIGCFMGHGAYGLLTKEAWVPYFGIVDMQSLELAARRCCRIRARGVRGDAHRQRSRNRQRPKTLRG